MSAAIRPMNNAADIFMRFSFSRPGDRSLDHPDGPLRGQKCLLEELPNILVRMTRAGGSAPTIAGRPPGDARVNEATFLLSVSTSRSKIVGNPRHLRLCSVQICQFCSV